MPKRSQIVKTVDSPILGAPEVKLKLYIIPEKKGYQHKQRDGLSLT